MMVKPAHERLLGEPAILGSRSAILCSEYIKLKHIYFKKRKCKKGHNVAKRENTKRNRNNSLNHPPLPASRFPATTTTTTTTTTSTTTTTTSTTTTTTTTTTNNNY